MDVHSNPRFRATIEVKTADAAHKVSTRCHVFSGGYCGRATPDPIPNSVVKPSSVDGTAGETLWESRTPPDLWPPRQRGGRFYWFCRRTVHVCSAASGAGGRGRVIRPAGLGFTADSRARLRRAPCCVRGFVTDARGKFVRVELEESWPVDVRSRRADVVAPRITMRPASTA